MPCMKGMSGLVSMGQEPISVACRLIFPAKLCRNTSDAFHPDVVIDSKNCVTARFCLLKPEMSLREKDVEIVPGHITPDQKSPDAVGPLPSGRRFEVTLHRDNVQISPLPLSAVVGQYRSTLRSELEVRTTCFDSSSQRVGPGVCVQPYLASRTRAAASRMNQLRNGVSALYVSG